MRTISVRQPFAMLIVRGGKDIENRSWSTEYRGPLLIHAGVKPMSKSDWQWIKDLVKWNHDRGIMAPDIIPADVQYGGIVGMVTLADVVTESQSGWFDAGGFGWVLTQPRLLPFHPCKGQLGFWDVPYPFEV